MFSDYSLDDDPQTAYNNLMEKIQDAAEKYIPYTIFSLNPSNKFRPKLNWTPELSQSVACRRLALSNFRRNPTPQNLLILKRKISEAQKLLRNTQRLAWHTFCSSVDQNASPSDLWNKMRWIKGHRVLRQHVDDTKASNLLRSLCPDYVNPLKPTFTTKSSSLDKPITLEELTKNIKNKDTAPGCEEISFSMVKNLPLNAKLVLIELYNVFLLKGFVPKQWREVKIVPIPKPGRDPNSVSALRPISLISCICKIFHSILQKRLEWYIEKNELFSGDTLGFRKSRSCIDNLSRLVSHIQKGFCLSQTTIGCFIDIDNAYNNIDITGLLMKLDHLGIGHKICKLIFGSI